MRRIIRIDNLTGQIWGDTAQEDFPKGQFPNVRDLVETFDNKIGIHNMIYDVLHTRDHPPTTFPFFDGFLVYDATGFKNFPIIQNREDLDLAFEVQDTMPFACAVARTPRF